MDNKINILEPLIERIKEYGQTSYELFKLKTLSKLIDSISAFISRGIVVIVLLMFLAIFNIGVALWLGELLGKLYYGFFCVAGFYGILGGVLFFFLHNWVKKVLSNSIILHLLN